MRSRRPKALHEVAGRSMLGHVLATVQEAGATSIAVVVGPEREDVAAAARAACPGVRIFVQHERRGTAHAVLAAREALDELPDDILVAFADTPLVEPATLTRLRAVLADGAAVVALAFEPLNPAGYGRLLMRGEELAAIREHKDASEAERAIRLCNGGLMALDGHVAARFLDRIGCDNAQNEFYLPDVVEVARAAGRSARAIVTAEDEVRGINDRAQLADAEAVMQGRLRRKAMRDGATLVAPETVFFSFDTELGQDVTVEPNVVFGTGVKVASGAVIHAFSHLEGARVGEGAQIGPFARLRPGADLSRGAKVGNFVELKNAAVGEGAKINHLSYVGDATIGARANIGAGTITCNYDGFRKFRTTIGEGAFIGSNSALVAPVTIGDGAYVASGSVIVEDVTPDGLGLARARQVAKEGWAAAFRARPANRKDK